jgi:outer membrane immunogenic protein
MKRILLSTISLGLLGLISPALGADLPMKAPPVATPLYDWSGLYVGVFGGGGWGNHNIINGTGTATPFANYTATYPSQGGLAGGEAGYNVQSGNVVVGIEATGFWSDIKGSTGGWAFGDILHTNTDPVFGVDQFTVHANGLVAGGGLAYALTNNLIGKIEYSYYKFNGYNRPAVGATGLTANGQLPYTTNTEYSVLTVGLDYKFGGGPVVAKY